MPDGPDHTGKAAVAISNAAVQLTREYTGRGPTKAKTTITDDLVVIVMRDTMLKAEKTLAEHGEAQTVVDVRRRFQDAMREDYVATVEEATGRRVLAFLSDNHIDPDLAVEIFVLEPDGRTARARPASEDSAENPAVSELAGWPKSAFCGILLNRAAFNVIVRRSPGD